MYRLLGPEDVSLLERCPHFRGCYVQALMELGPEDVSLLERCPHFRGCCVQASPEDVSLISEGVIYIQLENESTLYMIYGFCMLLIARHLIISQRLYVYLGGGSPRPVHSSATSNHN